MNRLLALYINHGQMAAMAINRGDWQAARQFADVLRQASALEIETAAEMRAAFADAYCQTRRTQRCR